MDEIITYSMMDPIDEARLRLENDVDFAKFVPLKNPLTRNAGIGSAAARL